MAHSLEIVVRECLAIQFGLKVARSMGTERVFVESDCQAVVGMFCSGTWDLSLQGKFIEDCLSVGRTFSLVHCSWINRNMNHLAHMIAAYVSTNHGIGRCQNFTLRSALNLCNASIE
ncbi:hypothetical protein Drorol1_Dr00011701 [Drosera rotundifolia]